MDLILDVKEKEVGQPKMPSFPQAKSTNSGFPEHKKRTRVSAFKQKRQRAIQGEGRSQVFTTSSNEPLVAPKHDAQSAPTNESFEQSERRKIDRENKERLASMSPQEIEAARQELFSDLDPKLLQMLLRRANLDEKTEPSIFDQPTTSSTQDPSADGQPAQSPPEIRIEDTSIKSSIATTDQENPTAADLSNYPPQPTVTDEDEEDKEAETTTTTQQPQADNPPPAPAAAPDDTPPTSAAAPRPHWPRPQQPEDLTPDDPDFLQKLHEKYFPSLPADPSKLAWMAPIPSPHSPADQDSPYYPGQSSVAVSALRFDFRGSLLSPRAARALPTTKGLHHHGEAPEAAGYTVGELARLARSAVPAQRCVAYRTLGRILYRLGRGEFGGPADDLARGIWSLVEDGAVVPSLYEEAGTEEGRGHRSARAYAIEAIWLLEKGGWKGQVRKAK
ncbi:RPAP1-like protein [Xylariaceae sp. FL0662B]|nr:RPAP1-like protein [Xylariaceae sp. FL0662B]